MIWAAAFAMFSVCLVAADGPPEPLKFRNASPEVRVANGLPPYPPPVVEDLGVDLDMLRAGAGRDAARCAKVTVSPAVKFRNRTLAEIPDIQEPELRLANQLMSSGCNARAFNQLDTVLRKDPNNLHARYVIARMMWMQNDMGGAHRVLNMTLAKHPDFVSAKVLVAGIRFAQGEMAWVKSILDDVEQKSPTDLWIYMSRLRIEEQESPSEDLRLRLLDILRNPSFPPNAREEAAELALSGNIKRTEQQYEEIVLARLEFDSYMGDACKMGSYPWWLSEDKGRYADVIKLLDSPRAQRGDCLSNAMNRTLLAQAYLMEAAKISAGPTGANAHLTQRAGEILRGDYISLKTHAQARPQYQTLKPFLAGHVKVDQLDYAGLTALCRAVKNMKLEVVRDELASGADPKQPCYGDSLVGYAVRIMTNGESQLRRDVIEVLLAHGAPLTRQNIETCRINDGCFGNLGEVFEKYADRVK